MENKRYWDSNFKLNSDIFKNLTTNLGTFALIYLLLLVIVIITYLFGTKLKIDVNVQLISVILVRFCIILKNLSKILSSIININIVYVFAQWAINHNEINFLKVWIEILKFD